MDYSNFIFIYYWIILIREFSFLLFIYLLKSVFLLKWFMLKRVGGTKSIDEKGKTLVYPSTCKLPNSGCIFLPLWPDSFKGIAGASYIPIIQAVLPRLLGAAAPREAGARENRRQCLKVFLL